jgi:hypothetical protein
MVNDFLDRHDSLICKRLVLEHCCHKLVNHSNSSFL